MHEEKPVLEKPKKNSAAFQEFQESLGKAEKPEDKIRLSLEFMRGPLSDRNPPRFRDFWEGKRICLPFFKEALSPGLRAKLWAEYIEISQEGRQLKEMLEEQSSYAAEQIELAIVALEKDLDTLSTLMEQIPSIGMLGKVRAVAGE